MTLHVWNPSDYPTFCSCMRPMDAEDLMCDACKLEQAEPWKLPGKPMVIVMLVVGILLLVGVLLVLYAGYEFFMTFR